MGCTTRPGSGDSVAETGGDDSLETANPDDARSIGLAMQTSRAGKCWCQGERDTERFWVVVRGVVFLFLTHSLVK